MSKVNDSPILLRVRTISHHLTWWLGKRYSNAIPLVFVIGFPKSGTTWVSQITADYLQLPFPRHSLFPIGCAAVVHGHELASKRYPRGVYVMRDGRDALTSMYFYITRRLQEGNNPPMSRRQRRLLPGLVNRDDVARNIGPFVENQMKRPHVMNSHWGEHTRSFYEAANSNLVLLKYEDLKRDGCGSFAASMERLTGQHPDSERILDTLDRFSFEKQAGRRTGLTDRKSFHRKGESGDWRNHFTREAADVFDHYCGQSLIQAGYEPDRTWVTRFKNDLAAQDVRPTPRPTGSDVTAVSSSPT